MSKFTSVVIEAFDYLGGDPSDAVAAATGRSYSGWVNEQSLYVAGSGAAAMAVPMAHVPAMVADFAFLMHRMAFCAWGVGEISGCTPAGKEDLSVIFALWSGAVSERELFCAGVGGATTGGALTTTVSGANPAIGKAVSKGLPKAIAKGLPKALGKGAGFATSAGLKVAAKNVPALGVVAMPANSVVSLKVAKLSEKVAAKFATKLGAKVSGKTIAGFIPVVGAIAGAGINVWIIESVAASARTYYTGLAHRG